MITQLNMRIDSDVKAAAERVCADIGLTLSAAINIYLRKIAAENRIPFDLTGSTGNQTGNEKEAAKNEL